MSKQIHFNAFEMNCVGHQSPGLWSHPRDRSSEYKDLVYWTDLAKILERGFFDGIFIADVIGYYDVYKGSNYHALHQAAQIPVNDPLQLAAPIAMVTEHLGIGITASTLSSIRTHSPGGYLPPTTTRRDGSAGTSLRLTWKAARRISAKAVFANMRTGMRSPPNMSKSSINCSKAAGKKAQSSAIATIACSHI